MKCALEHTLSVLNPNSFVFKWKRVVSMLSPLSLFSRGGSHLRTSKTSKVTINPERHEQLHTILHLL